MDITLDCPNDFVYDIKTCEVESMEEHFISDQCGLNSSTNTLVTWTSIINSIEDESNPLAKDVFSLEWTTYPIIQFKMD
jgi:hypothetical protein